MATETNVNANETKIDAVKADTAAILLDTDTMEADLTTEIKTGKQYALSGDRRFV